MPSTKRKSSGKLGTASAVVSVSSKSARKPPQKKWQLQTAKAKFSEVFRRARTEGPQHVVKHGREEVVVISKEEFEKFQAHAKPTESLAEFLMKSPLAGSGINLNRPKDYGRKVEL